MASAAASREADVLPCLPFALTSVRELRFVDQLLGYNVNWTCHSGRAGFATDSWLSGLSCCAPVRGSFRSWKLRARVPQSPLQ